MKHLVLTMTLVATTVSVLAETTEKKVVRSESAYLEVCPANKVQTEDGGIRLEVPAGCLNKIRIKSKSVVYKGANAKTEKLLAALVGNNQFHGIRKSQKFTAEGYFTEAVRMGYKRETFVVTHLDNVIMPK